MADQTKINRGEIQISRGNFVTQPPSKEDVTSRLHSTRARVLSFQFLLTVKTNKNIVTELMKNFEYELIPWIPDSSLHLFFYGYTQHLLNNYANLHSC